MSGGNKWWEERSATRIANLQDPAGWKKREACLKPTAKPNYDDLLARQKDLHRTLTTSDIKYRESMVGIPLPAEWPPALSTPPSRAYGKQAFFDECRLTTPKQAIQSPPTPTSPETPLALEQLAFAPTSKPR